MALDYSVIGQRLRKLRIDQNLTQEELAERLEVSIAFLSRIERGTSQINLRRLVQLCEILGVSEGFILNGTSDTSTTYLTDEFSTLLSSATPRGQKLIYNIAKVITTEEEEELQRQAEDAKKGKNKKTGGRKKKNKKNTNESDLDETEEASSKNENELLNLENDTELEADSADIAEDTLKKTVVEEEVIEDDQE